MTNINVRFYRPHSLFSRVVSWLGKTEHCHVDIVFLNSAMDVIITESQYPHGVSRRRCPYVDDKTQDTITLWTEKPADDIDRWVQSKLKTKYGFTEAIMASLRKWTGVHLFVNSRGVICTEYVVEFLRENGGPDIDAFPGITPDELMLLLSCYGPVRRSEA